MILSYVIIHLQMLFFHHNYKMILNSESNFRSHYLSYMEKKMFFYYFSIANLNLKVVSPIAIVFQQCMAPFLIEEQKKIDIVYKIEGHQKEIEEKGIVKREYSIIKKENRYIRKKLIRAASNVYQVAIYPKAKETFCIDMPVELIGDCKIFERENILDFLALEEGLLSYEAFILHSSFISWRNNGIVFTAPSGTGKSTQADLWHQYEGAEIYNGDRTIIRRIEGIYRGFGSPYAGSSGIYRNESAPIKAIIVLTQAPENQIERLNGKSAFLSLYKETLMNTWNPEYMSKMTDLLMDVVANIPIYHLACRPDQEAVELVKNTLFREE